MISGLDHVQVAIPAGGEGDARRFYGELLGLIEVPKPAALAMRGGCWFGVPLDDTVHALLHVGVENPFQPARKAHPCFLTPDAITLARHCEGAGLPVTWDHDSVPGVRRFHTADFHGNRIEIQQS